MGLVGGSAPGYRRADRTRIAALAQAPPNGCSGSASAVVIGRCSGQVSAVVIGRGSGQASTAVIGCGALGRGISARAAVRLSAI